MTVQQKSYKVLVIGDTCIDQYFMCRNTRLNPESSAPLVRVTSTHIKHGMAGNVGYCLEALGLEVDMLTSTSESTKTRYVNAVTKEQLLRVDFDDKVDPITEEQKASIGEYDAIVVADYDKGFLSAQDIDDIVRPHWPVFVDTKKKKLSDFFYTPFLKVNEHEANAADKVPNGAIITLGCSGVSWYNNRWPALKSETVDVCGAGDAFMAGMVYGYLTDRENMIEHGIVNGGLAVRHIGTYAPTLEEHNKGLDEYYKQCRKR